MKKIFGFLTLAAALLIAGNANAQFGAYVGMAPQTYVKTVTSGNTSVTDTLSLRGYAIGGFYEMPINSGLNMSVGLQFRMNTKTEQGSGTLFGFTGDTYQKIDQSLIDIPILFKYSIELADGINLTPFVGPTVTYALSGKTYTKVTASAFGASATLYEGTSDWYGENSTFSKLDVSVTVGASISLRDFRIFGGYNMGLMNLASEDNTTLKGSNLFFGLGYVL